MQRNTNLGMTLGQMIAGAFDGSSKQKGIADGYQQQNYRATAEKNMADAEDTRQQIASRSDDALIDGLVAGMQNGINGDNVRADFKAHLNGSYKPREQQGAAMPPGSYMPAPEYVSKFPELQQKFSGLKQMLALGDKSLPNLSKSIGQDYENKFASGNSTQGIEDYANRQAAIKGNIENISQNRRVDQVANGGLTHEAMKNLVQAITLGNKDSLYDFSANGTGDNATGEYKTSPQGYSAIAENKAKANQANAGANENNANANLYRAKTDSVKAGKGDGSNATTKDMAQLRDDIRGEFDATYPKGVTGARKGAPNFRDFEKSWLKQFNVDEGDYYRSSGSKAPATTKAKSNPAYDEYKAAFNAEKDPAKRKRMTDYARKKGLVK